MRALVYHGPGLKALEDHPKPVIRESDDAVVKVTRTTICGTDLHILKGDVPTCQPGRILGHEGVGVVEETGPGVATFKPGVPDLEAGNMLAKQLAFLASADAAGIVLGARVPIVLASRADSARTRIASCALAVLLARARVPAAPGAPDRTA